MAETKKAALEAPYQYPDRAIRLERAKPGEANYEVVALNGKRYKIMRGVEVKVPYPVYAILRNQQIAMETADAYLDANTRNID